MQNRILLNLELGRISAREYKELPESGIVVVLDNVRSAHNVGSAFRTADSFKADKVWLCGICAVPPSADIHKSALGAEDSVTWEHVADTMEAVRRLKEDGYEIVSIEQTVKSVMLDTFRPEKGRKYALVFGNEATGLPDEFAQWGVSTLIPHSGKIDSLNLAIAAGIGMYAFKNRE